jgi:hypothetical protein
VDRKYYLKSLYTPLIRMFLPIVVQLRGTSSSSSMDAKSALLEAERILFDITKHRPWRHDATLRTACMENSPLFMAFKRQRERAAAAASSSASAAADSTENEEEVAPANKKQK